MIKSKINYFMPSSLNLQSICEKWKVDYEYARGKPVLKRIDTYRLHLKGPMHQRKICYQALQKFLKQKAKRHLGNWLEALSEDLGFQYKRLSVRGQKSIWGSCTEEGVINLNYKLLFLPYRLTEYVLLHELCHTRYLDHSKTFWSLLYKFDIEAKKKDKMLLTAYDALPGWIK